MRCLYLAPTDELGMVDDPRLDATTERHKLDLRIEPCEWQGHPITALDRDSRLDGLVIEMCLGWVGRDRLILARRVLALGRRVWVYWPGEHAIECLARTQIASRWRHWLIITAYRHGSPMIVAGRHVAGRIAAGVSSRTGRLAAIGTNLAETAPPARAPSQPAASPDERLRSLLGPLGDLDALIADAAAVPFPFTGREPSALHRVAGCGVYLRTDYWARIESGGSYGHTCYVAKELAAVTERLVCFMAHRYRLLDELGLHQVVLTAPSPTSSEDEIVVATAHYYRLLRPAFEALRPSYIYERLCLGNYVGALLSRALNIPYIVEYNGSELSMRRSFDGTGYEYESAYLKAEAFAFKQATMISVVSAEIKSTLIARGVDPDKILVNPNGADLDTYAPADAVGKRQIRAEIGLDPGAPVVGFTGTFGGWHGIDVLAAAIPAVCERAPRVQFLLIGDGNCKHLVDRVVAVHALQARVLRTGRVPQAEGARLLKACDIYVSPHHSHMVDSRFFGSPTKIFEYMAMAGGIVASDLEQIGETLSPALSATDLRNRSLVVAGERAVLCTPGDVDEFVDAVVGLVARPDLWPALGRNAREAITQHYSWTKHVGRLWPFLAGEHAPGHVAVDPRREPRRQSVEAEPVGVGGTRDGVEAQHAPSTRAFVPITLDRALRVEPVDAYKDEIQRQWNNDPAGSHYVTDAEPHTLQWFLEAEAYRYGEYAPWMAETMEFERHRGERVLEIGGGLGSDLSQFARHGAHVTDLDLSSGHLELAKENFRLRGLTGEFVLHDAESLAFDDNTFDVVYSHGVLHHTPNTGDVVQEIHRVLKPGGRAIVMMYAENSLHYWRNLVFAIGLREGQLQWSSMGEIMSRSVERSDNSGARPLVKVYTRKRLRTLFDKFVDVEIVQRQMVAEEVPRLLTWVPLPTLGKLMGWNLVVKASKPR